MNKNYIFVLTVIVVVIVLVMTFYSPIVTSISLQQILLTKDCDGIDKWSKTVASEFDFLLISEFQMNDAADLSDECVWKIIESNKSTDTTDPIIVLDEILKKRDCEGMEEWIMDRPKIRNVIGMTMSVMEEMVILSDECRK